MCNVPNRVRTRFLFLFEGERGRVFEGEERGPSWSTGRYTSAEIADLAPLIHIHVFRVGKRQFLELDDETKFKMSGHSARICRHFSKSAQIKIDVFPREKRVYRSFRSIFGILRQALPRPLFERRMRPPNRSKCVMVALRAALRTRKRGSMIILIFHRV